MFAARLHAAGILLKGTATIPVMLDVEWFHQAIWQWKEQLSDIGSDLPMVQASGVSFDETDIRIDGEASWVYAAIDVETKLLLDIEMFGRHGTDPAAHSFID